ncbi:MAG: putative Ig domain-containing protein [Steroidobacteraceae bacterium]|nr:putative Ig domain-containing protein [Steroidobacteraceae bacterium]
MFDAKRSSDHTTRLALRALCAPLLVLLLHGCAGGGTEQSSAAVGGAASSAPVSGAAVSSAQANRPPVIAGNGAATITAGQAYDFTPNASDPDGNALSFSAPQRPAWTTFDSTTGRLQGTPQASDLGVHPVTLTVSDGQTQSSIAFLLTVERAPNRAPEIGGNGAAAVLVGQSYSFTPTASDPEGAVLSFSAEGLPAWLSLDPARGTVAGTPGAGDVGSVTITLSASDGSLRASISFVVTVGTSVAPPAVPTNRPPTLVGHGGATVTTGQAYLYVPIAADPDGDRLTFAIAGRPAWASFDPATGRLEGRPGSGDAGTSTVTISVSDGRASAATSFAIAVLQGNRAPTISGSGGRTLVVGQAYAFTPTASDPDGDPLTFSASGVPAWLSFDVRTGALSGTPAAGDVGTSAITITANDGRQQASLAFAVTVTAENRPPTLTGNAAATVMVGAAYAFTPTASDPDGDRLTFTAAGRPAWMTLDAATGALGGTPGAEHVGSSSVTLTVSDGGRQTSLTFTVTVVQAANGRATVTWEAPTQRTDGTPLTNLAGFRVYYGRQPGSLTQRVDVSNPTVTTVVVENLTAGTWHFAATAVDANGVESDLSGSASKTIL